MTLRSFLFRRTTLGILAAGVIAVLGSFFLWPRLLHRLPYHDSFSNGRMDEWTTYGGTWKLAAGAIRNDSAEPGAKLITGALRWRDYKFDADVQLLGDIGDAGLIVRSTDEEQGIDSYNGYYVGFRITDGNLVIGRADHGWREYEDSPIAGGIQPFHWYHLRVVAYGCTIAASATNSSTGATTTVALKDDTESCAREGRIGLRSNATGGIWRAIQVGAANHQDLAQLTGNRDIPQSKLALLPLKEVLDINKNRFRSQGEPFQRSATSRVTTPLESLRLIPPSLQSSPISVRGVVILTQPALYIQDSTGGASVSGVEGTTLKIGDEVEAIGVAKPGEFSATLQDATVRLLWAGTPNPPVAITVSQAATGDFDARLVELEGYFDRSESANKSFIVHLHEGDQSFRAVLNGISANAAIPELAPGSLLRIRGVCVVSPNYTTVDAPFTLLLQSMGDIQRLAGPPWWNTRNLIMSGAILACICLLSYLFYVRAERWRLRAVIEERQRLAHELHDTLAQSFAGVGFQLRAIQKSTPSHLHALRDKLEVASRLVEQGHQEARRSISTLRPNTPEVIELLPALAESARAMMSGGSVAIDISTIGDPRQLTLRITDALYRVGIEAIANAVRHARATQIELTAEYKKHALVLTIEDDGVGFIPETASQSFGLRGMTNRVERVGGTIQISSIPNQGSRIKVTVPLPRSYGFRLSHIFRERPRKGWTIAS
jgi:signal transduction histidine kinase